MDKCAHELPVHLPRKSMHIYAFAGKELSGIFLAHDAVRAVMDQVAHKEPRTK